MGKFDYECFELWNIFIKSFCFRITISPPTNFLTKTPTIIKYDQHEFIFEGFSLLSHVPIGELPTCKVFFFSFSSFYKSILSFLF